LAAAHLLGSDVAVLLSAASGDALLPILDRELSADVESPLIEQLSRAGRMAGVPREDEFQKMRSLLQRFRAGLNEGWHIHR
jgi:predicted nucleotidyltransferase